MMIARQIFPNRMAVVAGVCLLAGALGLCWMSRNVRAAMCSPAPASRRSASSAPGRRQTNRRLELVGASLAFLVVWLSLASAGEPVGRPVSTRRLTLIGSLGGAWSTSTCVDNHGMAVGAAQTAAGKWHAFSWCAGRMKDLGTLGGPESRACAISPSGAVVGWSDTSSGGRHAFVYRSGRMEDLGASPGYPFSAALAIDNHGVIFGAVAKRRPPLDGLLMQGLACAWHGGQISLLKARVRNGYRMRLLNVQGVCNGVAVGDASVWEPDIRVWVPTAFRFVSGAGEDLSRRSQWGPVRNARAINPSGEIATGLVTNGGGRAVIWREGRERVIELHPGGSSEVRSLNARGEAVGDGENSTGDDRAWLWNGHRVRDLNTLVWSGPRPVLTTASSISDTGWIAGDAQYGRAERAFVLSP